MNCSIWFVTIYVDWSIVCIEGSQVIISNIKFVFLSQKIIFILANSVDPDGMSHEAVHLGVISIE